MRYSLILLCFFLTAISTPAAEPVRVIPNAYESSLQPRVAIAPDQSVCIVYGVKEDGAIYFTRSSNGLNQFTAPKKVATLPRLALGMRRGPRLVATSQALAISAISHEDGNLHSWSSTDLGATWTQAAKINSQEKSASEGMHDMAADSQGRVVVAWLDHRNKGTELWHAVSKDGGRTWGGNELIYRSPDGHICECCSPVVRVGAKGRTVAMWRNWLNGARDLYLAESSDGNKFGPAQKLGTGTWLLKACPMDGGDLTLETPDGKPLTVWRRNSSIFSAVDDRSEKMLAGQGLQPMVVSQGKESWFVWMNGSKLMVRQGGDPLPPVIVLTENGSYPTLALDPKTSRPLAVWESSEGSKKTIMAASW